MICSTGWQHLNGLARTPPLYLHSDFLLAQDLSLMSRGNCPLSTSIALSEF